MAVDAACDVDVDRNVVVGHINACRHTQVGFVVFIRGKSKGRIIIWPFRSRPGTLELKEIIIGTSPEIQIQILGVAGF